MEQNSLEQRRSESKKGLACAFLCAFIWGGLPIYWKQLEAIDSMLIILYRIVLVFIFVSIIALIVYKWEGILAPLRVKGAKTVFFLAGILITANWSIYIWAVNAGHIIQTSIGYYIEPLAVCLFGIALFHEKLDKYKITAFLLACVGVIILVVHFGQIPGIALSLAFTFSTYAAIKKKMQVPALLSVLYETMFLVPVALGLIIYVEATGRGAFAAAEPLQLGLLALAGVLTATPLMLFAMAAKRVSFVTLGVTEYISPSIGILLGIFLYHEPFDGVQLFTFVLIWIGLAIFTFGSVHESRKELREEAAVVGEEVAALAVTDELAEEVR